jgi:hypothetical protein
MIVQAAEARVRNETPGKLVGANNPCAIRPDALEATLKRYPRSEGVFEAISFGIVVQCGQSSVSLGLPIDQQVDLKKLSKVYPEMARSWDLMSEVTRRVFGEKDVFHDRGQEEDAALQSAGEKFVPELIAGRYDAGLALAVKGNVGTWESPSFQSLLGGYRGPISATEEKASYVPRLVGADVYRFSQYVPPKFPPLALQARIQGNVELQLSVQPTAGEVSGVTTRSGHPLLTQSAIDAVKQ